MQTANIGTVIFGTMRTEDLIPAFLDELEALEASPVPHQTLCVEIRKRMEQEDYFESEDVEYDLDDLLEALNLCAPPYCYFGAHPGDGADYGFWPYEDVDNALREGEYEGTVIRLEAGTEWPEDEIRERRQANCSVAYIAYINDHGNVSLWEATDQQPDSPIWRLV